MANPKILFVDDDNFLRKVYEAELKEKNFDVVLAVDGEEGLEKAQLEDPDLIILDMIMPKKSGFEVLTELQRNQKTRNIPVIILSNLGQREEVEKGMKLGADDYLVKAHFTPAEIVDKIKNLLRQKKAV